MSTYNLSKKTVADLRRELIEDGVPPSALVNIRKEQLICAAQSEFCSRYRDCHRFEWMRCTAKGINTGTATTTQCSTCAFTETHYQNGAHTEGLDIERKIRIIHRIWTHDVKPLKAYYTVLFTHICLANTVNGYVCK